MSIVHTCYKYIVIGDVFMKPVLLLDADELEGVSVLYLSARSQTEGISVLKWVAMFLFLMSVMQGFMKYQHIRSYPSWPIALLLTGRR